MKIINLIILTLGLCSCAGLKKDKNETELTKIKKIAIVAFQVDEPASAELGLDLSSGQIGASSGGSIIPQQDPHVEKMYEELRAQLMSNHQWQALNMLGMIQNPGYKKAYKQSMEGWQNKMPPWKGNVRFVIKDLLDGDSLRILRESGRTQLIKDLGVDAIAEVSVLISLTGSTFMGIGNRYPQSHATLRIYKANEEKPIWFESIKSNPSKDAIGKTGFIDETKLKKIALEQAKEVFSLFK